MKTLILAAIRCSFLLTVAAALTLAYPAKANLITNGGFETGDFTGWTRVGQNSDISGIYNGIPPHSGNFQALLHSGSFPRFQSIAQTLATTPGQTYTIDFSLANSVLLGQDFFDVTWDDSSILTLLNEPAFSYTEYRFNVTATSASTELKFRFIQEFFVFAGDTWLLDDVSVNPVGVPDGGSTVSLLGFALLGLAAVRRKLRC